MKPSGGNTGISVIDEKRLEEWCVSIRFSMPFSIATFILVSLSDIEYNHFIWKNGKRIDDAVYKKNHVLPARCLGGGFINERLRNE